MATTLSSTTADTQPTSSAPQSEADRELQAIYGVNDNATRPAPPTSATLGAAATPSKKAAAQPAKQTKKKKLRSHRRLYVDADGAATVEKSGSGNATIVGENVNVPVKALPQQAQLALQKNQRRFGAGNDEEDEFENEEDEDSEEDHQDRKSYQLGAFMKNAPVAATAVALKSSGEEQLESPEMCVQITNSLADQLASILLTSDSASTKASEVARLKTALATQQSILNNFVSTVTDETVLCSILSSIDRCNTSLAST